MRIKYNIKIDPEFESLIPPLSEEEFKQLRDNIVESGECHDPILIWNEMIVDGHNRWKIIQENPDISYQVQEKYFSSRSDAMAWMIRNQLGRRNLTAFARTELSLKLKPLLAEEAKKRQGERNDLKDIPQKSAGSEVRDEIAKSAKVSHDTVSRVEKLIEKAPEEVKEQLRRGEVSINKAYNEIREAEQPIEQHTKRQSENVRFSYQERAEERKPLVFSRGEAKKLNNIIKENASQMGDLNRKTEYNSDLLHTELNAISDAFTNSFRAALKRRLQYTTDELTEDVIQYAKSKFETILNDYYNQTL